MFELEIVVVVVVGVENWDCRVEEIEENERMRLNPDRGRDFVEGEAVVVEEYILEVVVVELLWNLIIIIRKEGGIHGYYFLSFGMINNNNTNKNIKERMLYLLKRKLEGRDAAYQLGFVED